MQGMDDSSASSAANFFGTTTGGFAAISLLLYRSHLPKARVKALEDILEDTEKIWRNELTSIQGREIIDNVEMQLRM